MVQDLHRPDRIVVGTNKLIEVFRLRPCLERRCFLTQRGEQSIEWSKYYVLSYIESTQRKTDKNTPDAQGQG